MGKSWKDLTEILNEGRDLGFNKYMSKVHKIHDFVNQSFDNEIYGKLLAFDLNGNILKYYVNIAEDPNAIQGYFNYFNIPGFTPTEKELIIDINKPNMLNEKMARNY